MASPLELVGGAFDANVARQLEAHLQKLDTRNAFNEAEQRKRSAKMLFVGSVSGFLGFVFAFVIGVMTEQTSGCHDLNGNLYKSGRGYFPATVSEMVHDPQKPAGKCFFAFCFVGAIFIFFSWYPTQLRNAYIGDDSTICCSISWVTFRQFVPAPGMMMLSIITTVPAAIAKITDQFCVCLHLTGAAMLFVGYFLAEGYAIGWGPFHNRLPGHLNRDTTESIKIRKLCLTMIAIFYTIFCALQVILTVPNPLAPAEDCDKWEYVQQGHKQVKVLVDTAKMNVFILKIVSYASEVICGIFLIASHLVIWYYCEERHYDLPEELRSLRKQFCPKEVDVDDADNSDSETDVDSEF